MFKLIRQRGHQRQGCHNTQSLLRAMARRHVRVVHEKTTFKSIKHKLDGFAFEKPAVYKGRKILIWLEQFNGKVVFSPCSYTYGRVKWAQYWSPYGGKLYLSKQRQNHNDNKDNNDMCED
jgi:hypothetical protein